MRLASLVLVSAFGISQVLAAQAVSAAPSSTMATDAQIHAIIQQRVEEKRSAGIVVGVLDSSSATRFVAYGDAGPHMPALDANSVFEIGSITKLFTATVLAQMVQEGKVRLDDPAQKYLPASVHLPTHGDKVITLGSLSEQNSGLPRMPTNFKPANKEDPYADYTVPLMYEFLNGYQMTRDPGAQFEYSNLGVGLLGHILARVDGKPYEQMVRDRVWKPLGMTHTAIVLSPEMLQRVAVGHDEEGKIVSGWTIDALAGAGAIRSTASDMLRFADANLHPERGALQHAMAFAQQERADAGGPQMRIGLNWFSIHPAGDTIVWHNGGTGGYRTFLGMLPSHRRAVVVLTNTSGAGADDIGMHLLVPALPLAPKPAPMKQRTAIALPAATTARYVGTYALAPSFRLVITQDAAGNLVSQATGQGPVPIWPETETDFFVKEFDAQLTFVRDASGAVTSLVLHQGGRDLPAPRVK